MSSVDVIVPCYNYSRYLRTCVASILAQENVDVRVLIIDDASSDETPIVAKDLSARDNRVLFRRHEKNRGPIATFNEGLLDWASAEYSLLISADDALAPGALARAVKFLNREPSIGMAYGMARVVGDQVESLVTLGSQTEESRVVASKRFLQYCCMFGNPVPTPTAVVRTELQHMCGGYRSDLPHTTDMEMWMRFALHGPIGVSRAVQAYYRWHGGNMSATYYESTLRDWKERVHACQSIAEASSAVYPEYLGWTSSMLEKLGEDAFWLGSRAFDAGDIVACIEYIAAALDWNPKLRNTKAWRRFVLKRATGIRVWGKVRPYVERIRKIYKRSSDRDVEVNRFVVGALTGWWPPVAELSEIKITASENVHEWL